MATEKTITTRVQMKTDTASNWGKATNFTPKKGEIIVYSGNPPRIKVGDGATKVNALPFATSSVYVGDTEPTGDYDLWIDTSSDTGTGGVTAVIFTQDEKTKLAGIAANANNYSLPTAGSTLGGVKTTSTVSSTTGLTAVPIISGVPYYKDTNTTYTAGAGLELSSTQFKHKNAVTAKTAYGSTATTASANGGSITVTDVKYDAQGHITGSTDRKITLSQKTYTLAGLGGVPTSRTVNGKALTSNISLTAADVGAAAADHTHDTYLPLSGGTMTGNIDWGNAKYYGLKWTTDNGTVIALRPYSPSNVFQITMKPSNGTETSVFNLYTDGKASFSSELTAGGYIKGVRFRAEADNDYPTYEFKANSQTNYGVMMQVGSTNMWGVYEYPKEFDGQSTRYYEAYRLPEPATGLTANKSYKILTDKVAVSIEQGGTGATERLEALKNLADSKNSPFSFPCLHDSLSNTGIVTASATTKEVLTAMNTHSEVAFVHNKDTSVILSDAPLNYAYIELKKGYNTNYMAGWAHGGSGALYNYFANNTAAAWYLNYNEYSVVYSSSQPSGFKGRIWLKPV